MIGRTTILVLSTLLLVLPASGQQPPDVAPSYATDGRPGFVYVKTANALGWEPLEISGMPSGMSAKVLTRDEHCRVLLGLLYLCRKTFH